MGVSAYSSYLLVLALLLPHISAVQLPPTTTKVSDSSYTLKAEADRVGFLPGGPAKLDFGLFSGYVTVDEDAGRALFYVFAEARVDDPTQAPLLLWLNGGPGCSSLGGGFMSELGPFYPTPSGTRLQPNPYSWNNLTNVLWLESPAFVGFSYSNDTADQIVGDARTAADARQFLIRWLQRFPQFAQADLYLSGESYGGHYVPNLAREIVRGNKRPTAAAAAATVAGDGRSAAVVTESSSSSEGSVVTVGRGGHLNLKGFFVGNAWTDAAIDNRGALDFWYSHAMISAESHKAISENCDFNTIGPLMRGAEALTLPGTHTSSSSSSSSSSGVVGWLRERLGGLASAAAAAAAAAAAGVSSSAADRDLVCARWLDIAQAELGNINIYEIYADVCVRPPPSILVSSSSSSGGDYRGALLGHVHPRNRGVGGVSDESGNGRLPRKPRYDPCIDGEVEAYFNLPSVQAALHANQTVKLPWRWTDCTSLISYSRQDLLSSMLPTYRELLAAEPALKLWVFSGDVDGIVPVLGSRRWIESLQLPLTTPWRPWTSRMGQVGGYRVDYQGLTFATVRNSGHMVPYVTPERAFHLLGEFLYGDRDGFGSSSGGSSSSSSQNKLAAA